MICILVGQFCQMGTRSAWDEFQPGTRGQVCVNLLIPHLVINLHVGFLPNGNTIHLVIPTIREANPGGKGVVVREALLTARFAGGSSMVGLTSRQRLAEKIVMFWGKTGFSWEHSHHL